MSGLAPDQKRILVLEPDREHAERLRGILARSGFTANLAVSGRQAIELASRRAHDAVLVDFDRAVREKLIEAFREAAPAIPVVLLVDAANLFGSIATGAT